MPLSLIQWYSVYLAFRDGWAQVPDDWAQIIDDWAQARSGPFLATPLIWSLSKSHRLLFVSLFTVRALFGVSVNHTDYCLHHC